MRLKRSRLLYLFLLTAFVCTLQADEVFKSKIQPFLQKYCMDCHDNETQKGGIALHDLKGVSVSNYGLWQQIWEQVSLKEMPPRKKKKQPALTERYEFTHRVLNELVDALEGKGEFTSHLQPSKGNHLDHDLLFNTKHKNLVPSSSPARVWRLHQMEHAVRLNELVSIEPAYDPAAPGKYARGDSFVPTMWNDYKIHFGLESLKMKKYQIGQFLPRLTQGYYPVLGKHLVHGLRDYPSMHELNSSKLVLILDIGKDILKFMAYGPKSQMHKENNDSIHRGLTFSDEFKRPKTPVYELMNNPGVSDERLTAAINYIFETITLKKPTKEDTDFYLEIVKESVEKIGKEEGVIKGLSAIFVNHYALYRSELAEYGTPDKYGRVMLEGEELVLAINHAFSYIMPNDKLYKSLAAGKLKTREDVKREVTRILNDDSIRKPRILQFFREYFDYGLAADITKDRKAAGAYGKYLMPYASNHNQIVRQHRAAMINHIANTDRLVELIVQEDKNVFKELLTTDRVVLEEKFPSYFRNIEKDYKFVYPFHMYTGNLFKAGFMDENGKKFPQGGKRKRNEAQADYDVRKNAYEKRRAEVMNDIFPGKETPIHVRLSKYYRFTGSVDFYIGGSDAPRTLTRLNKKERRGILTHPSWLVSHSDALDNHAILRGKWIRERLLGDAVPDVPITVDAQLPDEPKETLRHRMRVTREGECWRCHRKMDPLGLPFEMYNHVGLYREKEKNKPVDTSGEILFSGDPSLDGPVKNAIEMIDRLAASERVEQVFVRHVFRFWMGRNETINDAPILQEAHKAYKESGGSMKALLISLLTSDAFLYRKVDRAVYSKK